jgi:hypothetical protein
MKEFLKPILQILLMAVGMYAVLLGSYWFFIA